MNSNLAELCVNRDQGRLLSALNIALHDAPEAYPAAYAIAMKQAGANLSLIWEGEKAKLVMSSSVDDILSPTAMALRDHARAHGMVSAVKSWMASHHGRA